MRIPDPTHLVVADTAATKLRFVQILVNGARHMQHDACANGATTRPLALEFEQVPDEQREPSDFRS